MTNILRTILLIVSVLAAIWMFRRIRKCKIKQEDATFWIVFAIILAVLGIFPQVSYFMSQLLGIYAPVNFIFLSIIFMPVSYTHLRAHET